ncbi:MAG: ABC transporter permease [Gammaproteobacteria bacterium]|jgi:ABC-2 type transport system permease protein|nr:ABC transporter permease [Gammaproteobacteria bacterium]
MGWREKTIAFYTIMMKEIRRFMRIWIQTVLPAMITTALYFVIFGNLIGQRIGDMQGVRYIDYIVPGLILMTIITNSYANVVSSFYSAKFQRNIEEMLVSPVPSYIILLGYMCGGVARGLVVGVAVTGVAFLFSGVHLHNILVIISFAALTAVLFSLGGFINAVFAKSFDDISIIPTFVLTPLTYLGGIFYTINLLPEFWQHVSLINPILYMVNAFRFGFLGVSDINVGISYLIVCVFIIGLFTFCLYLLNRGHGIRT